MAKYKADGIELVSEQPVSFVFANGHRATKKIVLHVEIVFLLAEIAPSGVEDAVKTIGRGSFEYTPDQGSAVTVSVEALNASTWKMSVRPGGGKAVAAPPKAVPGIQVPAELEAESLDASAVAALMPDVNNPAVPKAEEKSAEPIEKIQVESVPGEPTINRYLRMLKAAGASDLHLSSAVIPLMREGGEMKPIEERGLLTNEELEAMFFEIMPERNKKEYDETNDTDFAHAIEGVSRFRANVFRDRNGIGGVFRVIPFEILDVKTLGLPPQVLNLCWLTKGLVLVTGPTGSGKSTTLASLIDFINENRADHIITIEDPVEFVHPNKKCLVNQREVGEHTKSFKAALRAALREDPDIVLVGELRDLETIAIAIETAETGHLVFGTLHTTSAISTVDRIIDQFPGERQEQIRVMLSESFRGCIAQVLCKKIGGGRAAAYEILLSNPAVSNLIREGKTFQLKTTMQTGRGKGMQTMNDHLIQLVRDKIVTPEEAFQKSNEKEVLKAILEKEGHKIDLKVDY